MDICPLSTLCVVCYRPLRRADPSSRGVLPSVVCHWVWSGTPLHLQWVGSKKQRQKECERKRSWPKWGNTATSTCGEQLKITNLFCSLNSSRMRNHVTTHATINYHNNYPGAPYSNRGIQKSVVKIIQSRRWLQDKTNWGFKTKLLLLGRSFWSNTHTAVDGWFLRRAKLFPREALTITTNRTSQSMGHKHCGLNKQGHQHDCRISS
jgi:hypothetical protein